MPESKTCAVCSTEFQRKPSRSQAQWDRMRCCSAKCANTLRARQQRHISSTQRRWAERWKRERAEQDRRELIALSARERRRQRRLARATRPLLPARQFIAGNCPDCGTPVVVIRGWWNDSIRCPPCTTRRWRGNHRRRARLAGVPYEDIDPVAIFKRDGWRCGICGQKTRGKHPHPRSPTLDHIIPLAVGGSHTPENVQCACFACNSLKGARAANDQLRLAV